MPGAALLVRLQLSAPMEGALSPQELTATAEAVMGAVMRVVAARAAVAMEAAASMEAATTEAAAVEAATEAAAMEAAGSEGEKAAKAEQRAALAMASGGWARRWRSLLHR